MLFNISQENSALIKIEEIPNAFFNNILIKDSFDYDLFPTWFQEHFGNRKDGLYKKAKKLFDEIKVSGREQEIVDGYLNSLAIDVYCLDVNSILFYCENISREIFDAAKEYFNYLYTSLDLQWFIQYSETNVLEYVKDFKRNNNVFLCPVCGVESIKSNPYEARASLDHWLCKSKYPFYSVNWNNLLPLGDGCNKVPVKGEDEVLWVENDRITRRSFFHPFHWVDDMQISLICNEEPSIDINPKGSWEFTFKGVDNNHQDLIDKWNVFFRINGRWIDENLHEFIEVWTVQFAQYLFLEVECEEFETRYLEKLHSFKNARSVFNLNPKNRVEWFFLNFLINEASPELFDGYKKIVREHLQNTYSTL